MYEPLQTVLPMEFLAEEEASESGSLINWPSTASGALGLRFLQTNLAYMIHRLMNSPSPSFPPLIPWSYPVLVELNSNPGSPTSCEASQPQNLASPGLTVYSSTR